MRIRWPRRYLYKCAPLWEPSWWNDAGQVQFNNNCSNWYRKGRNGLWTHKPGGTQATNLDNSMNLITDPRTADRGGYTDFCTFMIVVHGHVKIK